MPVQNFPVHEERFFVLFDAGETNSMRPVFEQLEAEGKRFKFLVTGTAATLIKDHEFSGKRLELKDFDISEIIDQTTPRETKLSQAARDKLKERIYPQILIVGTASKLQQQMLRIFPQAEGVAFVDNAYYETKNLSFKTVNKVQQAASKILCPTLRTLDQLVAQDELPKCRTPRTYQVVGKPTVDAWAKKIEQVDQTAVLTKLGFSQDKGPIVTMIGGYGEGYDRINPFFDRCAAKLRREGYQVIMQPHPKIATPLVETVEALAVSDYVVGFNSSVLFDSLLIGKKAIYMALEGLSYNHFAVQCGYAPQATDEEQLFQILQNPWRCRQNVKNELLIPQDSVKAILEVLDEIKASRISPTRWQIAAGKVFHICPCF